MHGTQDLPLERLFKPFGMLLAQSPGGEVPSLGAKTSSENNEVRLSTVYTDSPAQQAGLSAGDVLVAIDGVRVTPVTLDRQLMRRRAGDCITVHAFRRDELRSVSLQLGQPNASSTNLTAKGRNVMREAWLKPSTPVKAKKQRLG